MLAPASYSPYMHIFRHFSLCGRLLCVSFFRTQSIRNHAGKRTSYFKESKFKLDLILLQLVISLKMSSTWIRWSGHESTYIYCVLESQRLTFPFQAKSLWKAKHHMLSVENGKRLLSLICNYAKTQRLAKRMLIGTEGIMPWCCLQRALIRGDV